MIGLHLWSARQLPKCNTLIIIQIIAQIIQLTQIIAQIIQPIAQMQHIDHHSDQGVQKAIGENRDILHSRDKR